LFNSGKKGAKLQTSAGGRKNSSFQIGGKAVMFSKGEENPPRRTAPP